MTLSNSLRHGLGGVAGGRTHGAVAAAAVLDVFAVDAGRVRGGEAALACLLPAVVVDILEIEGVDVAGDVAVSTPVSMLSRIYLCKHRKPWRTQEWSGKC